MTEKLIGRIRSESLKLYEERLKVMYQSREYDMNARLTDFTVNNIILNDCIKETYAKHIKNIKEEDTNKIYVYAGTYKDVLLIGEENFKIRDVETDYNDKEADYRLYHNLECLVEQRVDIDYVDQFDVENFILYGNYDDIQRDYIVEAVRNNEEVAIKKVIKKYWRKKWKK